MGAFLTLLGFIGLIVFIVMAIVSAVKKTGKFKNRMLFAVGFFVLMFIGVIITPGAKETAGSAAKVDKPTTQNNNSAKQSAADIAKQKAESDAKKKSEAQAAAQKKAADEAAAKKAADEAAKNPNWNVSDVNFDTNGNGPLAINLLNVIGDISQKGIVADAGDVFKAPWNYYGKPTKLSGTVAIIQDYPPGSNATIAGIQSQVVFMADDSTPVIVFSTIPSGKLKVNDPISVVGYPVGLESVDNKLGGKTEELVIVTNKLQ